MQILRAEGVGALYKGIGAVMVGAAPAQALYFVGYEGMKELLQAVGGEGARKSAMGGFAAGFGAQLVGSVAWVPMDVVKERLQIEGQMKVEEAYGGSLNALRRIVRSEGVAGLYRAYFVHQLTWAPFNGLYFMIYERSKEIAKEHKIMPGYWESVVAGVVASALTNPMDLVKTRLQVARSNPGVFDYEGSWDCARKVMQREGFFALFDGCLARIVTLTPRLALAVTTYEMLKDALTRNAGEAAQLR